MLRVVEEEWGWETETKTDRFAFPKNTFQPRVLKRYRKIDGAKI
jgi:hypothetical protein